MRSHHNNESLATEGAFHINLQVISVWNHKFGIRTDGFRQLKRSMHSPCATPTDVLMRAIRLRFTDPKQVRGRFTGRFTASSRTSSFLLPLCAVPKYNASFSAINQGSIVNNVCEIGSDSPANKSHLSSYKSTRNKRARFTNLLSASMN